MSSNSSDLKNLYKDLQSSINDDKLYWIRNDAKIKAVVTSKNYDEFRDYVAAAHLSSLTRKELMEKRPVKWNKTML
ncbi:unnamed protein product [Phyllotreta striolata]|uniref:Dynein attachment factor N-terminal domain-containing protein n=1 Tax=Phyllotreta striolata TaxID=444603 RepID=A0A9N9TIZ6_PHYSR|nr:unnamed protein product [Phyllotreta striolata]